MSPSFVFFNFPFLFPSTYPRTIALLLYILVYYSVSHQTLVLLGVLLRCETVYYLNSLRFGCELATLGTHLNLQAMLTSLENSRCYGS